MRSPISIGAAETRLDPDAVNAAAARAFRCHRPPFAGRSLVARRTSPCPAAGQRDPRRRARRPVPRRSRARAAPRRRDGRRPWRRQCARTPAHRFPTASVRRPAGGGLSRRHATTSAATPMAMPQQNQVARRPVNQRPAFNVRLDPAAAPASRALQSPREPRDSRHRPASASVGLQRDAPNRSNGRRPPGRIPAPRHRQR